MSSAKPSEADATPIAAPIDAAAPPRPIPARSIAFLSMAAFVSAATLRVADPLLPQIGADFGVTTGAASIVVTAFSISYGLLQALFGPIGDRFGKYRTVATACFLSALGVVACGLAGSLNALTLARLASGATAAAIIPLSMAWIGDEVPYQDRQPMLARFLSGQILGLIFGQAAGGILSEHLGWRQVFGVLSAFYVLAGVCLVVEMRRDATGRTRAAARAGVSFASSLREVGRLARRPWVRTILFAVSSEGLLMLGAFAFVGSELQRRFGVGSAFAGTMLGAYGIGGLTYAATVRQLVNRLGERGLAVTGGTLIALSFVVLALTPTIWLAPPAIALAGLGFYMLHNTLQTNATQMAPEARGAAVAMFASAFFIGQTIGVALAAQAYDRWGAAPGFLTAAVLLPALGYWLSNKIKNRTTSLTG
jgi:MFS transporter, YNFM family, putative membrane transport protein